MGHTLTHKCPIDHLVTLGDLVEGENPVAVGVQHVEDVVELLLLLLGGEVVGDKVDRSSRHVVLDVNSFEAGEGDTQFTQIHLVLEMF